MPQSVLIHASKISQNQRQLLTNSPIAFDPGIKHKCDGRCACAQCTKSVCTVSNITPIPDFDGDKLGSFCSKNPHPIGSRCSLSPITGSTGSHTHDTVLKTLKFYPAEDTLIFSLASDKAYPWKILNPCPYTPVYFETKVNLKALKDPAQCDQPL